MTQLNINQFELVQIRGQVDWSIARRGTLSVKISENQATAVVAGQPVILDPAATGPLPEVIAAANSDPKAFFIAFNEKQDSYVAGEICEIVGNFGPVIWLTSVGPIAMGATVENVIASSGVQTLAAAKAMGIALLNGVDTNLVPTMLITPCVTAS